MARSKQRTTAAASTLTPQEAALYEVIRSPAKWGQTFLVNRDGTPRRYRPYQVEDLECAAPRVVHMDGRAVGKTVDLATLLLWFVVVHRGKSALVVAPYQGHLDTIIDEVDFQIEHSDILRASLARNARGVPKIKRQPYVDMEFAHGGKIYFRPAGDRGNSFRSLHVDYLFADEAAWLPEEAWNALRQCLNGGGTFRVYSTPNGLRDTTYYRITEDKDWTHFHWPSWIAPDWSEARERELLTFYNGNDSAGWRHEVAGEHGMPSYGAFVTEQVLAAMTDIAPYRKRVITWKHIEGCEGEEAIRQRVEQVLDLGSGHGLYWLGGDLGYTNDPTELLLFEEEPLTGVLTLRLRVHAERIPYPVVTEIVALIDTLYAPQGIGVDQGGNGMSVVQELTTLDKYREHYFSGRLVGYDFGGSITVGEDKDGRPITKRVKEQMTALINEALHTKKLRLPKEDHEIENQLCTQTYTIKDRGVIYSKGNDHINDAMRCALLRRAQERDDFYDPVEINVDVSPVRLTRKFY